MISSVILFAVIACAHAEVQTIVFAGHDAQSALAGWKPDHTFTMLAGECVAYYPLEKIGCFRPSYSGYYVGLAAIKIEVEVEADRVYVEVREPIEEFYVIRYGNCNESTATVKVTKQCMIGETEPSKVKNPLYLSKDHTAHF